MASFGDIFLALEGHLFILLFYDHDKMHLSKLIILFIALNIAKTTIKIYYVVDKIDSQHSISNPDCCYQGTL
jgi:hypothetical protein